MATKSTKRILRLWRELAAMRGYSDLNAVMKDAIAAARANENNITSLLPQPLPGESGQVIDLGIRIGLLSVLGTTQPKKPSPQQLATIEAIDVFANDIEHALDDTSEDERQEILAWTTKLRNDIGQRRAELMRLAKQLPAKPTGRKPLVDYQTQLQMAAEVQALMRPPHNLKKSAAVQQVAEKYGRSEKFVWNTGQESLTTAPQIGQALAPPMGHAVSESAATVTATVQEAPAVKVQKVRVGGPDRKEPRQRRPRRHV